jgi:hypothetical protein
LLLNLQLVWYDINLLSLFTLDGFLKKQCDTFLRLAKESVVHEQVEEFEITDLEALVAEVDDDKCFAAMSVSKTISTVCCLVFLMDAFLYVLDSTLQVVSSVDSSPEILTQLQEIIIPIIVFSLENRLLGTPLPSPPTSLNLTICAMF